MSVYQCPNCEKSFNSPYGLRSHINWHDAAYLEKMQVPKNCSKSIKASRQRLNNRIEKYNLQKKRCKNCQSEIEYHNKIRNFCSRSCSARYSNLNSPNRIMTSEQKDKLRISLKDYYTNHPDELLKRASKRRKYIGPHTKIYGYKSCTCCNKNFWARTDCKTTCSPECARINSTVKTKKIYYTTVDNQIVVLESSWELQIAKWLDEKNIKWIRPKHIPWIDSNGKKRKYYPDFYLTDFDVYLDPKNDYIVKQDKEKIEAIMKKVKLYYGRVDYIKNKISDL